MTSIVNGLLFINYV